MSSTSYSYTFSSRENPYDTSENHSEPPVVEGTPPQLRIVTPCNGCGAELEFIPTASIVNVRCYKCKSISTVNTQQQNQNRTQSNRHDSGTPPPTSTTTVATKDISFYEILGVTPDASQEDIKKGYYKMARLHHPDKHPDDPDAEERFKKISIAYQVLSDPRMKDLYDKHGQAAVGPEADFGNAREIFSKMFGGGKFEDFIGELMIMGAMDETEVTPEQRERLQNDRVQTLADKLESRLEMYVRGNTGDFESLAKHWVTELKEESYGVDILRTVGTIYEQEGKKSLGGFFGFAADLSGRAQTVSSTVGAIKAAVQLQRVHREMETDEARRAQVDQKFMEENILPSLWKLSKLEVEATLRRVCETVLTRAGVPRPELKKRAEALKLLGKIFQTAK